MRTDRTHRPGGTRLLPIAAAAVAATALFATVDDNARGNSSARTLAPQMARLKAATGAYHNEAVATASGFAADDVCVDSPHGGMGHHYVNDLRIQDDAVSRDKPEVLLYAPARGNERALVGIEYFKVDDDQDLSTDDDRPRLFGRPFDGPMEGHAPGMPIHYDLHVWAWRSNPDGLFAPFNPRVSCP
ncbi:MAG TPA: hypothetical protein VM784_09005 [Actinomycetota bacterium]|nr:hypothetical protein [Actinomycetota bacterium]